MNKTKTERIGKILRETKETQIEVEINIGMMMDVGPSTHVCNTRRRHVVEHVVGVHFLADDQ